MNFRRDFQFDPSSDEAAQLDNQDDLSNIDWSNPMEFMKSLSGPMPEFASHAKVRKEAREYSNDIFASYELLKQILQRHEATIHKRWTGGVFVRKEKVTITVRDQMEIDIDYYKIVCNVLLIQALFISGIRNN